MGLNCFPCRVIVLSDCLHLVSFRQPRLAHLASVVLASKYGATAMTQSSSEEDVGKREGVARLPVQYEHF